MKPAIGRPRPPELVDRVTTWLMVTVVLLAFGGAAVWNEYIHDDWTCMFSRCIRVKP